MPQSVADSSPASPVVTDSEPMDSTSGLRPNRASSTKTAYSACSAGDVAEKETPDQVLGRFGCYNPYLVFIFLSSAGVWCLTAMPMMSSAFIMGDSCADAANCTLAPGTLAKDFDLTGKRASLGDWTTSAFLFGNMVGGSFPAVLSDKFGRRPLLIGSLFLIGSTGCLSSLAPEIFMFILLRFVQGIFFTACGTACWVLAYESIAPSVRSYTALIFGMMWVTGYCLVTPLAYFFPDWRHLMIATSAPSIVVAAVYFFILPESFHFLISRRRTKRATRWLAKANRFAKKQPLNVNVAALIESTIPENTSNNNGCSNGFFMQLISNRPLFIYTAVLSFVWTCDTFVYYGLSFYSTQLAGNRFVNYALLGIIEIPSYLVSPFLLDKLGRRTFVAGMHAIVAFSFTVLIFADNATIVIIMWLLGKFAISCSFTSLFVYGSEIFPTIFRNGCLGICDIVARFGGAFAPAVRSMGSIHPVLPTVFFGVVSALATGLTFFLPETLNRELPDTPEQLLTSRKPKTDS